jgi:hypothetical protein
MFLTHVSTRPAQTVRVQGGAMQQMQENAAARACIALHATKMFVNSS